MWLNNGLGHRWFYALVALGCIATAVFAFTQIHTIEALLRFMPLYGFFSIGGFGIFAVYLPPLVKAPAGTWGAPSPSRAAHLRNTRRRPRISAEASPGARCQRFDRPRRDLVRP